eukprot:1142530-Pelagomonas_calceolata.AAC.2
MSQSALSRFKSALESAYKARSIPKAHFASQSALVWSGKARFADGKRSSKNCCCATLSKFSMNAIWALGMMEYASLTSADAVHVHVGKTGGEQEKQLPSDESYHHSFSPCNRLQLTKPRTKACCVALQHRHRRGAKGALAGAGRPVNLVGACCAVTASALGEFAARCMQKKRSDGALSTALSVRFYKSVWKALVNALLKTLRTKNALESASKSAGLQPGKRFECAFNSAFHALF